MASEISVVHVDDDPDFAALTARKLERKNSQFEVRTTTDTSDVWRWIEGDAPDCVVADYDMPKMNGIELLTAIRETHPELPFVLFTGRGSETIASEAMAAGVTDYLEKQVGDEQFTILANRVRNAVERYRAERDRERVVDAIETAQEGIGILDDDEQFVYVNEAYADLYGYEPAEMIGESWELVYPESEIARAREELLPSVRATGAWHGESTGLRADGTTFVEDHRLSLTETDDLVCTVRDKSRQKQRERDLRRSKREFETLAANFPDGAVYLIDADHECIRARGQELESIGIPPEEIEGKTPQELFPEDIADELSHYYDETLAGDVHTFHQEYQGRRYRIQTVPVQMDEGEADRVMAVSQNVTEQTADKRALRRQNERLDEFASIVSHDLRNPLHVGSARLELAAEECDSPHLDHVAEAHDRMEQLIDDVLTLARGGHAVADTEPVALDTVARDCWKPTNVRSARLDVRTAAAVQADRSRLKQLFENLYRNAIEHGGDDGAVVVGETDDGFYVADDGPGIPPSERDDVFEAGYSTTEDGTGFGLRIVEQISSVHGWDIAVGESASGGARFDVTGVEFVDA